MGNLKMSVSESVVIGPCVLHLGDCRESIGDVEADCAIADPPYGETSLEWDRVVRGWAGLLCVNSLWCFGSLRFFMSERDEFVGWRHGQDVVWEKHNGSNFHADRFKRVHELVVHWYKGKWEDVWKEVQYTHDAKKRSVTRRVSPAQTGRINEGIYVSEDGGPRMMRSVIYCRSCHGYAIHRTQKPVGLLESLVRYSCPPGGLVLDPFFGSGSTAEACIRTGRRFEGWEVDPDRFEDGCRRVQGVWDDFDDRLFRD